MKGNKAQIKKDIERFNQQYTVGAVITNSANGVIYHAKRKSDGFTCVVKVRSPTLYMVKISCKTSLDAPHFSRSRKSYGIASTF